MVFFDSVFQCFMVESTRINVRIERKIQVFSIGKKTANTLIVPYPPEMCASVGVDPLASGKGFWSEMLGVGDFYYELGVQIVEICMAATPRNGGLMPLEELRERLNKVRSRKTGSEEISMDDLQRAIKKLKGKGFRSITGEMIFEAVNDV